MITKYYVIYIKDGKEHRSPWFYSLDRCRQAQAILTAKHGKKSIIYMD